jgi:WbqC-like protein
LKSIAISQTNYIPWKGYFDGIRSVDTFVLYDDAQYTRRDWRNRNRIKTKDGMLWLTIPVEVKGRFHQSIRETKINNRDWAAQHWKTITACYSKARHFKEMEPYFKRLYDRASGLEYLSDVNFLFLDEISSLLGIKTEWKWSNEFQLTTGDATDRLLSICRQAGATDYFTGPAAKNYLNETLFQSEGIRIHYYDYNGYPVYRQLHGDFLHEVSIIDLLLNEGGEAIKYMKSFR